MTDNEQTDKIEEAVAALEFVVSELPKEFNAIVKSLHSKIEEGTLVLEDISTLAKKVSKEQEILSSLKGSKIVPNNTYTKQTMLQELMDKKLDGLIARVNKIEPNKKSVVSSTITDSELEHRFKIIEDMILNISVPYDNTPKEEAASSTPEAKNVLEGGNILTVNQAIVIGIACFVFGLLLRF